MLALERRNLILEKLQTERRVVVSELSQLYEVSEETIRRDLDKLEKEGLATKSYGGAVINENVSIDLPFNIRKNQNVGGKQKMAEIVAEMVQDGDHIFLDASTTAVFIAKALKDKERLTVITNSMEILIELSDVSGWNIISTGGVMKGGNEGSGSRIRRCRGKCSHCHCGTKGCYLSERGLYCGYASHSYVTERCSGSRCKGRRYCFCKSRQRARNNL